MSVIKKYDVYTDGVLTAHAVTKREILTMLNRKTLNLTEYCVKGCQLQGKYRFICLEEPNAEVVSPEKKATLEFIEQWTSMQKLFERAIWVKKGGRTLSLYR